MKNVFLAGVFLLASLTLAHALPSDACKSHGEMLRLLLARGQIPVAAAAERHGFALQFFVDPRGGGWSALGVTQDGSACLLMSGRDWVFVFQREG